MIRIILYTVFFIFPFGQLLRLSLPNLPGVTIHPFEVVVFLLVILWFINHLFDKKPFSPPLFFKEMAIFGFIAGLSLLFKIREVDFFSFISAFLYLLRLGNFLFFYWVMVEILKKENIPVFKLLIFQGIIIALFSLVQYLFLPDARFLFYLGWDRHYYRAIGPFLDPGFTGLVLILTIILLTCLFLEEKSSAKRILKLLIAALLIITSALTFSRLAYAALALGLFLIFWIKKRLRSVLVFLVFFLVVVFVLPKPSGEGVDLFRKSSFINRLNNYQSVLVIIRENFFTGVGFNNYRFFQKKYGFVSPENWQTTHSGAGADNSFLLVLATTGIFGFLAYGYLWFKILRESLPLVKERLSSLVILSTSTSLIFSAFFINSLFYPWILFWHAVLLAKFTVDSKG